MHLLRVGRGTGEKWSYTTSIHNPAKYLHGWRPAQKEGRIDGIPSGFVREYDQNGGPRKILSQHHGISR
jgi:hypothetical protein